MTELRISAPIAIDKNLTLRAPAGPGSTSVRMADEPADPQRASIVIVGEREESTVLIEGFTFRNGKGKTDGHLVNVYLFLGGTAFPPPGPLLCAGDPTDDALDCAVSDCRPSLDIWPGDLREATERPGGEAGEVSRRSSHDDVTDWQL